MWNRIGIYLFLFVAVSFPIISGFGACSGPPGGSLGAGGVTNPPPAVCPPSGTNPPGGFCVAYYDQNGAGVKVPHVQVSIQGYATGQPVPGLSPVGSVTSFNFDGRSVSYAWPQYCKGCEINEYWNGTYSLANDIPCTSGTFQWGMGITANNTTWPIFTCALLTGSSTFALTNSLPSSLTVQTSGFSTSGGMPRLTTYGPDLALISTTPATSVSPDGTSATFNFPKDAKGNALPSGHYATLVSNQTSSGVFANLGLSTLSIGTNSSATTPYGVDGIEMYYDGQSCTFDGLNTYCYPDNFVQNPQYGSIVTSSSGGFVYGPNGTIPVGSEPTSIKAYGTGSLYETTDNYGGYLNITEPSNAIVTNFGSNNVSILDLINSYVIKTITVGTKPVTVILKADQTKAYVANYGSATISEIDLASNTQSRVASVGAQPEALAIDSSGSAIWVGGLNYISKISLSNFSVIQSFSVSGQVTSMAVSAGQNALVYTTMATSGNTTTFQINQAAVSNLAVQGTYAQYTMSSSAYYALAITGGGPAPGAPGWLMSSGALVSAPYGNRYAVIGTPTGFAVIDLVSKSQMLQSTTAGAVRGIATDSALGMIYLTQPDANLVTSVPYPPQPQ